MNVNWEKMCYAQKHLFELQNIKNDMRRDTVLSYTQAQFPKRRIDCYQYSLYLYKRIADER